MRLKLKNKGISSSLILISGLILLTIVTIATSISLQKRKQTTNSKAAEKNTGSGYGIWKCDGICFAEKQNNECNGIIVRYSRDDPSGTWTNKQSVTNHCCSISDNTNPSATPSATPSVTPKVLLTNCKKTWGNNDGNGNGGGNNGGGNNGGGNNCTNKPSAPSNLTYTCSPDGKKAYIKWEYNDPVKYFAMRINDRVNPWNGKCDNLNPGDMCKNVKTTSYTLNTVPEHTYQIWIHAVNNNNCWSKATGIQVSCKQNQELCASGSGVCTSISNCASNNYINTPPCTDQGQVCCLKSDIKPPTLTPTLTLTPISTPSSKDVVLNVLLKFQGVKTAPKSGIKTTLVNVGIQKVEGNLTSQYAKFTVNDQGVWSGQVVFHNVDPGEYYLIVKGPKHIAKKICNLNPTETYTGTYNCKAGESINFEPGKTYLADLSRITLLVGDLPQQDGKVDSYDIALVRNLLGKTDSNSISKADVNYDGIVDTQDFALIQAALSIRYDDVKIINN